MINRKKMNDLYPYQYYVMFDIDFDQINERPITV